MSETARAALRRSPASIRRKAIEFDVGGGVAMRPLLPDSAFPLLVSPERQGCDLVEWAVGHPGWTTAPLAEHGALLLRGFRVDGLHAFERFMRATCPTLLEYTERSTPRTSMGGDIYSSTEYPAHLDIVQHNENSYASTWPRIIAFFCERPAARGGETPLADSAEVYLRLPADTRDLFVRRGVMYVRNYGLGVDLLWQEAYRTDDPAQVEAYCRGASIAWEWLDGGRRLRTRQVRPAVVQHPATGVWLWFNQAHLFHTSSLDPATREALHASFADEDLPRQTFFGDGSAIPVPLLDEVRDAYRQALRVFPWERGDVLLLDNMRISHGRRAFTGPRHVYVAMAVPWSHAGGQA